MEGYYSALESNNDLWYNSADVQLIYSTASEGGGQFFRPTFNWIFHSKFCYLSCKMCSLLLIARPTCHDSVVGGKDSMVEI